jgi:two-component system, chemotaxis family, sensor kinase CheA
VARLENLPGSAGLVQTARCWRYDSLGQALQRLASQATRIAARLGKQVDVRVDDHGVRLPLDRSQAIWANLVHVIRNAVDHGIEPPTQREAAGKPGPGRISLDASVGRDQLVVTVADDGAGVDWEAVRSRALAASLACGSEADLAEALFTDGFSTRTAVDETSGRGIGLSALREACQSIGARIDLDSRRGQGTVVRVSMPLGIVTAVPSSGAPQASR